VNMAPSRRSALAIYVVTVLRDFPDPWRFGGSLISRTRLGRGWGAVFNSCSSSLSRRLAAAP
jgi:hypothetical protein